MNFWSLKRAKRQKEGAFFKEAFAHSFGAFGVWSWGLLHEEDIEEELALFVGSKEQLPSIISWRDFIFEEGAWV